MPRFTRRGPVAHGIYNFRWRMFAAPYRPLLLSSRRLLSLAQRGRHRQRHFTAHDEKSASMCATKQSNKIFTLRLRLAGRELATVH